MPSSGVEPPEEREVREARAAAERAVARLVDALAVAGLPPLPSLEGGGSITRTTAGYHVQLGGCGVRTVEALTQYVVDHARCTGRVVRGELLPARLAELPGVREEMSHPCEKYPGTAAP
ncbi:hypothetical protein OG455_30290 [Kitasatospora sp. NBC_01287]|uniref:hypothetical protein n=1 Tax=Kitasatospora sp. NBC_01287 TaxID=2903573 RepID=UPI002250DFA6|nr:hypothetical protein [Kitasatospora sp. NBC_01287]MCX4749753.1 hypothetical protein [Kitasatospora sp. NBC_01287]